MTRAPFLSRVAAAPISWGVCEAPGWGTMLPYQRVLAEAQALGITAFEQGALGWLPTDPDEQRATLAAFGITMLGGFVPLVLHSVDQRAATMAEASRIAEAMAAAGGSYFVTAPVPALDDWHRPELSDAEWDELLGNLSRLDDLISAFGLTQVVHPHIDTDIEVDADFQRFIAGCDTKVCFDTGHLTVGGTDVVAFAREHVDRIGVVHLKDVDAGAAARQRSGELTLMQATQAGMFPSLGDGIVRLAEVIEVLERGGYDGWYVMETDVAITDGIPADGEGPVLGVARSLEFLRSLQLVAS
ncbi:MAG TPA: sugar phosphate isomerase/epimerase [Ilumatobacter sp.]|nr:sugar phosphate isomerase/epimerase [Ilumatobacter sp.]